MGASQSIPSTSEITDATRRFPKHEEHSASTKNGPKTKPTETNLISVTTDSAAVVQEVNETNNNNNSSLVVSAESDCYSSDEDEDFEFDSNEEKEADEFIAERRLILEETRKLREIAGYYYRPEEPVATDATSCSRCFFSRYSAETAASGNEEAERELVLADATNLKELAVDYLHPEKPIASTDATGCGRNYFSRASAPDGMEEEERERIMEDMKQLKTTAEWYLQPEKPVAADPTACGRNYFSRTSAQDEEDMNERERVLEEAAELKKMADWCMQPEKQIVSDTTVCGRNYFARVSAPDYDDEDIEEERERIMEDMKQLKTTAEWYLNRDEPVAVDSTACGRNYFSRPSAIHDNGECLSWQVPSSGWQLSFDFQSDYADEMEEERSRILAEAAGLKKVADWYMHPEKPVTTDGFAAGRNFFNRHSAPEEEDDDSDLEEERNRVLEETAELKMVADWYLHPEKPVVSDACVTGRNFFARPSASNYETEEDVNDRESIVAEVNELKEVAGWYLNPEKPVEVSSTSYGRNYFNRPSVDDTEDEEREIVLQEAAELKMVADWHMHPEKPVKVSSTSYGRNYFNRPSADDTEDEEREIVLQEAAELKMVADWQVHPEKPVEVSSTSYGRNYFDRPSAPEYEDEDDTKDEEREIVLQEAAELKRVAEWYMHPEEPVTVYSTACGRNYFNRPSAPEYEDDTEEEEQDLVLQEAAELKRVAEWYMHPEEPVTVYSTACGRNYFTRPSAPEYDEEERDAALADALELKMVAEWYMQPEKPVTFYATACGRNYFSRPSAPIQDEDAEELKQILADAKELKMVAEWYMHPEEPITVYSTACGRNFFSRPSVFDDEMEEERNRILDEANELKKVADWHLNPEKPIDSDCFATARNYFSRPSAPEYEDDDERDQVLAEAKELKEVASWHHHPEEPVTSNIGVSRNYFTRPSAPEYEAIAEVERNRVLSEAKELKNLAVDYLHPEIPVTSNIGVTRNYFTRPSATIEDTEEEEERARILADALELKKLAADYLHPEKPVAVSNINCARNYFDRPSAQGHEDYIHSKGHANDDYYHMEDHDVVNHDDYHHYDYEHDMSVSHNSFHSQSDHFEMDEDVFHGFRESINAFRDSVCSIHEQPNPVTKEEQGDGKEGNLSRSPSSIMLFEEAAI